MTGPSGPLAIGFPADSLFFLRKASVGSAFLPPTGAGSLEAFLEFGHREFGQVLGVALVLVIVFAHAEATGFVNFDEGDLAALHGVSDDRNSRNFIMAALVSKSMV